MKQRIKDKKYKMADYNALMPVRMTIINAMYDERLIYIYSLTKPIILCHNYYFNHFREIRKKIRHGKTLRKVFVELLISNINSL